MGQVQVSTPLAYNIRFVHSSRHTMCYNKCMYKIKNVIYRFQPQTKTVCSVCNRTEISHFHPSSHYNKFTSCKTCSTTMNFLNFRKLMPWSFINCLSMLSQTAVRRRTSFSVALWLCCQLGIWQSGRCV